MIHEIATPVKAGKTNRPQAKKRSVYNLKIIRWQLISGLLLAVPLIWYLWPSSTAGYFRRPLTISTELAANFGEVRAEHYHLGLDIRTGGRENLPVYAAADGFISRVLITPKG